MSRALYDIRPIPPRNRFTARLARPGGNVTGSTFFWLELSTKRLELLKDVFPERRESRCAG